MARLRHLAFAAATGTVLAAASPAAADSLTDAQKEEVRALIRETILENPEIITDAVAVLRARQAAEEEAAAVAAIEAHRDALFNDPNDPVMGNPDGDVTLVEFFDYQCGYCKRVFKPLMDTVTKDGNVRLVMKEFPILGPASVLSARWSLAAKMQDRYEPFHAALMNHRGDLTEDVLRAYADKAGMDLDQAAKDAQSEAVEDVLRDTMKLAASMGISGTPAFIVGDQLMPGAVGSDRLESAIAAARDKG